MTKYFLTFRQFYLRPGSNVELHMSRTQCKLGKLFKFIYIGFGLCEVRRLTRVLELSSVHSLYTLTVFFDDLL